MKSTNSIKLIAILSGWLSLVIGVYSIFENTSLSITFSIASIVLISFIVYYRSKEPYEYIVLSNLVDIKIKDQDGKEAHFTKKVQIQTLKNGTRFYRDMFILDGKITSLDVSPGIIDKFEYKNGKYFIRVTFGKELIKGEIANVTINCVLVDTFLDNKEYWGINQTEPTNEFILSIHFPSNRTYKDFRGIHVVGNYTQKCQTQPAEKVIEGKSCLVWNLKRPNLKDYYNLEWHW